MFTKNRAYISIFALSLLILGGCSSTNDTPYATNTRPKPAGFEVKFLVGSALKEFCNQAATKFNQQKPKLDNGKAFYLSCEAKGSGDVVNETLSLAQQLQNGSLPADSPQFPTLLSVDGEIYHSQLIYQVQQIFPGQNYIPEITDAPLLAHSPMVFMVEEEIAPGIEKQANLYQALITATTHQDLDPNSSVLPIKFVHTAPTRSNSGLQTLVTQFVAVSGKRPEELTVADVETYQSQVQKIQSKITRYGTSTSSLAKDMVNYGIFWASVASVYESSVIQANSSNNNTVYRAIYPQATFTSNMRVILPNAPWVSADEKAAAEQVIEFLRSPQIQAIATEQGLRPGVPGVELGAKFSEQYGVNPNATYDSLRVPAPEVVDAMLKSWQEYAKKASFVVIVVDSSGSMKGNKLPAVQNTLKNYIENLGPKEKIALIDFDSEIRNPVIVDGTPEGKAKGLSFVANLRAGGGTRLYDAALYGRNWLSQNLSADTINAVIILTDGQDADSTVSLNNLQKQLKTSDFSTDTPIAFFTVGYGNKGDFSPEVLLKIAEKNGGYYRHGDPETISTLMSDLQFEF